VNVTGKEKAEKFVRDEVPARVRGRVREREVERKERRRGKERELMRVVAGATEVKCGKTTR
jgi:hypothetical protein